MYDTYLNSWRDVGSPCVSHIVGGKTDWEDASPASRDVATSVAKPADPMMVWLDFCEHWNFLLIKFALVIMSWCRLNDVMQTLCIASNSSILCKNDENTRMDYPHLQQPITESCFDFASFGLTCDFHVNFCSCFILPLQSEIEHLAWDTNPGVGRRYCIIGVIFISADVTN